MFHMNKPRSTSELLICRENHHRAVPLIIAYIDSNISLFSLGKTVDSLRIFAVIATKCVALVDDIWDWYVNALFVFKADKKFEYLKKLNEERRLVL